MRFALPQTGGRYRLTAGGAPRGRLAGRWMACRGCLCMWDVSSDSKRLRLELHTSIIVLGCDQRRGEPKQSKMCDKEIMETYLRNKGFNLIERITLTFIMEQK